MSISEHLSRRGFLRGAAAAVAAPYVITTTALGQGEKPPASQRVAMGFIGVGGRGSAVMKGILSHPAAQAVAVCDVDIRHRKPALRSCGLPPEAGCNDFRELLERDDVDAGQWISYNHLHKPSNKEGATMKPRMLRFYLLLIFSGLLATGHPVIAQGPSHHSAAMIISSHPPMRAKAKDPIITEENLRAFLIWAKQNPTEKLQAMRRGRGRINTGRVNSNGMPIFSTPESRATVIKKLEDRWLLDRMPVIWARAQTPEHQGHIGLLNQGVTIYRVVQVQDENNAIMHATARVINMIDRRYFPPNEWDFWLTSPLVATFRDGQEFKGGGRDRPEWTGIPGVFKVAGAKTYTTTLGAKRTIDLIVSVDLSKYMESIEDQLQENQPQEKPPRLKPARSFRTWTDATGEHKTEARFHSYGMGQVTIEKKDGETIRLPMERLSETDRAWVREHIGKH